VADDPVVLAMMHDTGCREILVGFESLSPEALDGLETKRNWKQSRVDGSGLHLVRETIRNMTKRCETVRSRNPWCVRVTGPKARYGYIAETVS